MSDRRIVVLGVGEPIGFTKSGRVIIVDLQKSKTHARCGAFRTVAVPTTAAGLASSPREGTVAGWQVRSDLHLRA